MNRIRKMQRADKMVSEPRKKANVAGKIVYLFALISFFLWVTYYLFGGMIILRLEGEVVQDEVLVEAPTTVSILEVYVKPGQIVEQGTPLFRVVPIGVNLRLAELRNSLISMKVAERARQMGASSAANQVPHLTQQIALQEATVERLKAAVAKRLMPQSNLDQAQMELFRQRQELASLKVLAEREALEGNSAEALETAIASLIALVGDGVIRAPSPGKVDQNIVRVGEVATVGEPLAGILLGSKSIRAFLRDEYLFSVSLNDQVKVFGAHGSVPGRITEYLPYVRIFPEEFNNSLSPRGRNRIVKIELDSTEHFVKGQHVVITSTTTLSPSIRVLKEYAGQLRQRLSPEPIITSQRTRM